METTKPKSSNIALKWAVFNVLVSIIITYVIQFANLDPNSPVKYLSFIPFVAFLFLTQKEYRDKLGGYMTFGEGFLSGFLFSVFAGLMGAVFVYIYYTFLSPQMFQQIIDASQTAMQEKGLPSDQVEHSTEILKKFGVLLTTVGSVFGSAFLGVIIALIGAAIFKKEASVLDIENNAGNYTEPQQ